MKKLITYCILLCFAISINGYSQVGIGNASPQAALDITSTADGLLIPRVALSSTTTATVITPTTSEMVYNTATTGDVTPGFYYWDGTKWVAVGGNGSKNWSLTGNSTTTAGTNFVGTTDLQDLVFKTNNAEKMRVTSAGYLGIGISTPSDILETVGEGGLNRKISFTNYSNSGSEPTVVQARKARGTIATPLGVQTSDVLGSFNFKGYTSGGAFGPPTYASGMWCQATENYTAAANGCDLRFRTVPNGTNVSTERMLIDQNGNIGIGTTTPATSALVDMTSTTAGFAMPRMTSVQRKAIALPLAGLQVYDTSLKGYYTYDGAKWDCASAPAGSVNYFANSTAPNGYLECNGQVINRTTYAELFAAIGTVYGAGNGSTTFNVPDLRGEFVRGWANGKVVANESTRTIGSFQNASTSNVAYKNTGWVGTTWSDSLLSTSSDTSVNFVPSTGGDIAMSGGGPATTVIQQISHRPRNVAMMACIKF